MRVRSCRTDPFDYLPYRRANNSAYSMCRRTSPGVTRASLRAIGILIILCALARPAFGATIVVTNTNDSGAGSLRAAIASASSGDIIDADITGTD